MHDHDHPHPTLPDHDRPLTYHQRLESAVRELLIEKGICTADDVRRVVEQIDTQSPLIGAKIVAKAWADPEFKKRLLADGTKAVAEVGVSMGEARLVVVENTADAHNLIVCTLCSCYPRPVLGLPPDWYKEKSYRSRAVREPRKVLSEFGTVLPEGQTIRVHDSTADCRYLVLPRRPAGTESMTEAELAELVSRDSMIGVALPKGPVTACG